MSNGSHLSWNAIAIGYLATSCATSCVSDNAGNIAPRTNLYCASSVAISDISIRLAYH